jgi:hypothetical protein
MKRSNPISYFWPVMLCIIGFAPLGIYSMAAQPTPAPAKPAVQAKVYKTGLTPSTPEQRAKRAVGKWHATNTNYPEQWSIVSTANSMFLNDRDGDCVLAGECVNVNVSQFFLTGKPVIIPDSEVEAWGEAHNALDGYDLLPMIAAMSVSNSDGLTYTPSGGTLTVMYCDGVGSSVNYQDRANICSALYASKGTLKMAVCGAPGCDLQNAVNATGGQNGWYIGAYTGGPNDHNVEMVGYGPASYCFNALGVPLPAGVDPKQFCYLVNTWSCIGVVNAAVVESSGWCQEIDMRTPDSVVLSPSPTPAPQPSPQPGPTRRMMDLGALLTHQYQDGDEADKAAVLSLLEQGEATAKKYQAKHHATAP